MFSGCYLLTSLDLTSFNTEKVTNMSLMFAYSNELTTIYVGSGWSTDNVTESGMMFTNCTNLVGEQGTTFNASYVTAAYAHIDGGTSNPGYLTTGTEAYAHYSPTNSTLTFYYDKLRSTRSGTTYDMPKYDLYNYSEEPAWYTDSTCRSVTRVVFNSSFANARPETTNSWFADMVNLQMITGMKNYLNTSEVIDMNLMFENCSSLTSIDVSGFNTGNTQYMGGMFWGCNSLTSINLSNFNTSNVLSLSLMFTDCENLTSLDLSNFNTANVTDMYALFWGCKNLTTLDISNFNTDYVTDMHGMFTYCENLTSLDVSHFNTANVTDMYAMFWGCQNLTTLDVSLFNTANVTDMYGMFGNCQNLTSLDVSHFNTAKVTDMYALFGGCNSLTSLDVTNFNTAKVTNMYDMFYGCTSLTRLDLSSFNTAKVTSMGYMFCWCNNLVSIYVDDGWSTEAVTTDLEMFYNCTNIKGDLGTTYDEAHVDKAYAHLDGGPTNPGYLSMKPDFLRGNVNGDGQVNTGDLSALINLLLGGGDLPESADCNLDGNKNIGDVPALINFLLSGNWPDSKAPAMNAQPHNAAPLMDLKLDKKLVLKEPVFRR